MGLIKLARVIGIAGSLLVLGAGAKWVWDYHNAQAVMESATLGNPQAMTLITQNNQAMRVYRETGWIMVALGAVSLISSLRLAQSPNFGGLVMIIAAFTPTLQLRSALAFTMPLLLGGIAAVFGLKPPHE